jgi:hypothetical protein
MVRPPATSVSPTGADDSINSSPEPAGSLSKPIPNHVGLQRKYRYCRIWAIAIVDSVSATILYSNHFRVPKVPTCNRMAHDATLGDNTRGTDDAQRPSEKSAVSQRSGRMVNNTLS